MRKKTNKAGKRQEQPPIKSSRKIYDPSTRKRHQQPSAADGLFLFSFFFFLRERTVLSTSGRYYNSLRVSWCWRVPCNFTARYFMCGTVGKCEKVFWTPWIIAKTTQEKKKQKISLMGPAAYVNVYKAVVVLNVYRRVYIPSVSWFTSVREVLVDSCFLSKYKLKLPLTPFIR